MEDVKEWLEAHGDVIQAGGNEPFFLDDPDSVYFVERGHVDVFFVSLKEGDPVGQRRHVFRAQPGCGLFGIGTESLSTEAKLQAAGNVGTTLFRINRSDLTELMESTEGLRTLSEMIDRWIEGLWERVSPDVPPRDFQVLEEDDSRVLSEGETAKPLDDVVWVQHQNGTSDVLGDEDVGVLEPDGFLPLAESAWLESRSEVTLTVSKTEHHLRESFRWQDLFRYNELAMEGLILEARREHQRRVEQTQERLEIEQRKRSQALTDLASVLDPEEVESTSATGKDPLVAACELVASQQQISIRVPDQLRGEDQSLNPLEKICHNSGFRNRKVSLSSDWWNHDNGPLLGFTKETENPVALIPQGESGYWMVNPATGEQQVVDENVDETLRVQAFQFYPSLPDKELDGWDLFTFGAHDLRWEILVVTLMGIAGGLLGLLTPILTERIFNAVVPNARFDQLYYIGLGLFAAAMGSALFKITRGFALLRIESKMQGRIQAAIWDRLLDLPVPFFRDFTVGDLARRVQGVSDIREALSGNVTNTIISSLFSTFNLALIFYYDVWLSLMAMVLVVLSIGFTLTIGYFRVQYQRKIQNLQGELAGLAREFMEGISKLRVAGAEMRAFAKWSDRFSEQRKESFKAGKIQNYQQVFDSFIPVASSMVIFATVAFWLKGGPESIAVGTFIAFNSAFGQFQSAANQMASVVLTMLEIVPLWERVQPILKTVPEVDRSQADPGELSGHVEMSGVAFSYTEEGQTILEDLSFEIEPGEFVALVGPSGSGKSTVLRLLLGFETPNSGSVYYDGQDLKSLNPRFVRGQIGVVLQNAQVQSGSLRKNITGASTKLDEDDAWEAAEMAGLARDIEEMPMGMNTVVMQGGGTLSGGQRQRLMIARALVRKPRIIYFDEATSALDNETQSVVSESMEKIDATRVVIAHRLSTIRNADRIFVIADGEIAESGSYEALMSRDGRFARLARRQLA